MNLAKTATSPLAEIGARGRSKGPNAYRFGMECGVLSFNPKETRTCSDLYARCPLGYPESDATRLHFMHDHDIEPWGYQIELKT